MALQQITTHLSSDVRTLTKELLVVKERVNRLEFEKKID